MQHKVIDVHDVVIRFTGDSGDGMQLTGSLFADASAYFGNEISTFPDIPQKSEPLREPLQEFPVSRSILAAVLFIHRVITAMYW